MKETIGLTLEAAMAVLKISEPEQAAHAELLKILQLNF